MVQKAFSMGKLSNLAVGGGIPNGNYQIIQRITTRKGDKANSVMRPGLQVTFWPVNADFTARTGPALEWSYGFGKDREKMWVPNAEGTGIVGIAGVQNPEPPSLSSNYGVWLKEMYNAGLPENIWDNDSSVLDNAIVYVKNIPEPEERKGFAQQRTATGEGGAAAEEPRTARTIAIIATFHDGGKPWEGEVAELPNVASVGKKAAPAGKKGPKTAPVTAPAPSGDEDPAEVLSKALGHVLAQQPDGCSKVQLGTGVFSFVSENYGEEMAQVIQTEAMNVPDILADALAAVGMMVKGFKVVPKA